MRKTIKRIFIFMVLIALITAIPCPSVFAHSLTEWANRYTQNNAGGNFHFAIGSYYHINGTTMNYYWENATAQNLFAAALTDGVAMWGGMINAVQTAPSNAHIKISYNVAIDPDLAAYVVFYGPSSGHYSPGGTVTEMVIGNIANYSPSDKKKVLGHELGHVWGILDLYTVGKTNLESIYSQLYYFNTATRHDKNAMYICLNKPWFLEPDGLWTYQKSPDSWAASEFRKISGSWYYFKPNARMATGWQQILTTQMNPTTSPPPMVYYWFYFLPGNDGRMVTGWNKLSGDWYYFFPGDNGRMATNWQKIDGFWYYLGNNGNMATGWLNIGSDRFFLRRPSGTASGGQMIMEWEYIDGYWYYFLPGANYDNGRMQTGWLNVDDERYFLNRPSGSASGGQMITGWKDIDGKTYYFYNDGKMASGITKIDGVYYYLKATDPYKGSLIY